MNFALERFEWLTEMKNLKHHGIQSSKSAYNFFNHSIDLLMILRTKFESKANKFPSLRNLARRIFFKTKIVKSLFVNFQHSSPKKKSWIKVEKKLKHKWVKIHVKQLTEIHESYVMVRGTHETPSKPCDGCRRDKREKRLHAKINIFVFIFKANIIRHGKAFS